MQKILQWVPAINFLILLIALYQLLILILFRKKIIIKIWVLCILLYSLPTTAQNHQTKTASYHNYDTECIEDKLDGSFIFMTWGSASTKKKAIDQACRNAINEILFKGVNKSSCNIRPLIIEVQAKEKYKEYIS